MPLEIEAKLKVEDLSVIRDRLTAAGAARVGSVLETNVFFDTEDRSLLSADQGLRLRQTIDAASGQKEFIVTFKGPRLPGMLKRRREIEVGVDAFEATIDLLEALGFRRVLTFEKRRESWTLDACKIELDELPLLGTFVEIEGPSETHVVKAQDKLRLSDHPMVKASYIVMLVTLLRERGDSGRSVTFNPSA
jgi:adenylate cyclase class 2